MNKVPLVHITRRKELPWYRSWAIRVIAVVLALILCGVITLLLVGENPISIYSTMIKGNFGTTKKVWNMLEELAIMLCTSLALAPAFRMKFWNLGGDGQVLMGCLGSATVMILLGGKLPNIVVVLLMLVAAIVAGTIWAGIPGFFKARFNTNETLFTLMMNYIATQIVAFFVVVWENPKGSSNIGIINQASRAGWLPTIFNQKYMIIIIVAVLLTVAIYVYMRYTKHGYEISVVGESESTAKYIGIKVRKVILRTAALSGAICGLVGFLLVGGVSHTLTTSLSAGRGFTGVMVAWLGKFNPFFMILTSFILVFLDKGAKEITTIFGLNDSFGSILTGLILFFIIGCEFFLNYQVSFRKKQNKEVA